MEHAVAVKLIQDGVDNSSATQWADLGAGNGVFTQALADLLQEERSVIYAVDVDRAALESIPIRKGRTSIQKLPLNFITDELPFNNLDGILMANSLHFAEDKLSLLLRLKKKLKATGHFVIVEYNTLKSSPWVPYPIDFTALQKIMNDIGFATVIRLHEIPSRFRQANLYSALVK